MALSRDFTAKEREEFAAS